MCFRLARRSSGRLRGDPTRAGRAFGGTRGMRESGLPGHIVEITYLGARTSYSIALDEGLTIKAERADLPASLAPGDAVRCQFPAAALSSAGGLILGLRIGVNAIARRCWPHQRS